MSDTFDAYRPGDTSVAPAESLSIDATMSAIQRALAVGGRTVLKPYLMLAGAILVLSTLGQTPTVLNGLAVDLQVEWLVLVSQVTQWVLSALVFAGSFLLGGLTLGLYRPLRLALFEGPEAVAEAGGPLLLARQRYGWALLSILLFSIIIGVGLLFCVLPGIAGAIFLGMMPFLVVAADEDIGAGFQRSVNLLLRNPGPLLLTYLAVVIIQLIVIAISMALGAGIGAVCGVIGFSIGFPVTSIGVGSVLGAIVGGVIGLPVGYLNLMLVGGTFTAVEAHDSGHQLLLDDEILV